MARAKGITFHTRLARYRRYMARNVDKLWGVHKMIRFYKKGITNGLCLQPAVRVAEAGNWWLGRYTIKLQDNE